ncbi:uncharacterized protein CELE_B0416.2 [Caenorhabditis elegans]|uniref:Uncharacterized protein B0416.2 n=1 Tax=Caenorhabditis elegans TaxID=6239 RepID=YT42_CAEEL|nr:Uncharacterized protein CELE_B0416.2 [Caenorhabditis elegans]Q11070.1 RecName: Full=Uncharacterized protein B0416.2; Flags: Precursor [Caenorhabditis elegans]CCD61920.1 Uncharacterized protein CELE_B0416.2 [Caenorhabditis elegans]|eukprot:NP_509568.1 Uncharacterized protein CELE_B0416.2 [Caenorhabditis elegans]
MPFSVTKFSLIFVALLLAEALVAQSSQLESVTRKPKPFFLVKKSMLVGMSETTEEVCQTVVLHNYEPVYGHLINGSLVEILQASGHKFSKTHVQCLEEDRPSCHGVKDDMYISECVTVYENANTMVRLFNSFGPYRLGTIRIPILCECRLRRQYRDFERPGDDDDDV